MTYAFGVDPIKAAHVSANVPVQPVFKSFSYYRALLAGDGLQVLLRFSGNWPAEGRVQIRPRSPVQRKRFPHTKLDYIGPKPLGQVDRVIGQRLGARRVIC